MIMHVTTNFAASGGAETMLARLLSEWRDSAVVVSLMDISDRNRRIANNPKVVYEELGIRTLFGLGPGIVQLSGLIRKHQPDIVLGWMYHGMVVSSLAMRLTPRKVPVVWTIRQALDDPESLTRSTRIAVSAARRLKNNCDGIIYNSQRALEQHRNRGFIVANDCVIPNGVPLPAVYEIPTRPIRVFGFAARFHPQKDIGTFFRAAAAASVANPDFRFIAVGRDVTADNPEVIRILEQAGLDRALVDLRGEQDDMSTFYREIDAFVLSSRTEGFPNVVAEAMSYGRPVIATDVGDAKRIVGNAGLIVLPGRPDLLSDAMNELGRLGVEEASALGRTARKRIEDEFGLPAIAKVYTQQMLSFGAA
jgi:glycosyltransferase involved in cell wall biosynthesis